MILSPLILFKKVIKRNINIFSLFDSKVEAAMRVFISEGSIT